MTPSISTTQNLHSESNDGNFNIWSFSVPKPIAYAYVLSTLYNVMFFMQFMSTPYIVKSLGISDSEYGYVQTLFGILQMCGGPLFGYAIQKFGIKIALYLCYISTLVSSIMLYLSYDLATVVLSRLPVLFMHGQQGHQTLLSLLTKHGQERTNSFGRMGLTFGIGFMLTPILSIVSSRFLGDRAPLITSAVLSILPFYIMEYCIDMHHYEHPVEGSDDTKRNNTINWSNVVRVLKRNGVANMLFKKNLAIVPMLLIFSILQMYMIEAFDVSPEMNSSIQMLTGVCIMFSNGFGVIWLRKKYDEQTILIVGSIAFVIAYAQLLFFYRIWMICLIMPFVSLGMSLLATVADSLMTSLVEENEQGVVLGIATGINSFVRTFAPAIGGIMLGNYGFYSFSVLGLVTTSVCLISCLFAKVDDSLLRREKDGSAHKID